jgi:DNA-binding NarL/FixJ family response regulator
MKRVKPGSTAKTKTRILLVDDHPMMRDGLAQLIAAETDLEICGEAGDAHEALEKVVALKPALVLTDVSLPRKNGLELTKDILAMEPDTLVLVISMHDESLYAERVLRAGARGYIMKQEGGKKIMEAIRRVLGGQVSVSENVASRLLEALSGRRPGGGGSLVDQLTDRELEVFQHLGRGLDTRQIADALHVSPKTVEAHRVNIKTKLKIASHAELIRQAVRWDEARSEAES